MAPFSTESGDDMDWSNVKHVVFAYQNNYKNRKLQEAIEIRQNHDDCNRDVGLRIREIYKPFLCKKMEIIFRFLSTNENYLFIYFSHVY